MPVCMHVLCPLAVVVAMFTSDHILSIVDIDECISGRHDCNANAECINTVGNFMCKCVPGYEGDRTTCISEEAPIVTRTITFTQHIRLYTQSSFSIYCAYHCNVFVWMPLFVVYIALATKTFNLNNTKSNGCHCQSNRQQISYNPQITHHVHQRGKII